MSNLGDIKNSISSVVANDLCIGCGLCESVTDGRVVMQLNHRGSLRPSSTQFTDEEEALLMSACPGAVAQAKPEPAWAERNVDPIWGLHGTMTHAWAGDPTVRHRAATGGVLTALGVHLLRTERVSFVLHVAADPDEPMRSRWMLSSTIDEVVERAGSRYGPTAPLAGLEVALRRSQPFAVIAKPCDLGAIHALSRSDHRIDQFCLYRLALVCGGQSRLTKSQALLDEFAVDEAELSTFRYRGHGNPGPTFVETKDKRTFSKTYLELWEDEAGWDIETRCKVCPDALGEAADVSAADVWPGGSPTGDDEGFNGIIVRSDSGEELVSGALESGDLVVGEPITPRQFDDFQPHQVNKKERLKARFAGMADAGVAPISTSQLRVDELGQRLGSIEEAAQRSGTAQRMQALGDD